MAMATATLLERRSQSPLDYAVGIVRHVCHVAGPLAFVDDLRTRRDIVRAIARHDTPALFSWLMGELSFQGIADRVAEGYIARHGNVTWDDVATGLQRPTLCAKLAAYSTFTQCNYTKTSGTCGNPTSLPACPLPTHRLRNGRLNQTAYSLHLFLRDVAVATSSPGLTSASQQQRYRRMATLGPCVRRWSTRCGPSTVCPTRSWRWRCRRCC